MTISLGQKLQVKQKNYEIIVPLSPSMAVARVMITLLTPASIAFRAFSILGSIPPLMVPSALYLIKSARVMEGITELSSSGLLSTPFFSKLKMSVTS